METSFPLSMFLILLAFAGLPTLATRLSDEVSPPRVERTEPVQLARPLECDGPTVAAPLCITAPIVAPTEPT